LAYTLRLDSSE